MGRVAKYKKIKAIDPFAKRQNNTASGATDVNSKYDLPPDMSSKSRKRKALSWDDDKDREKLLQIDAKRSMREQSGRAEVKLEGKKETESMRQFKDRVKVATKQV
jgi:hypothetical protein